VHTVPYDPQMTLLDLKVRIVQTLVELDYTAKLQPNEVRLRRALPADADGALFLDEMVEISRAGLTDGSRIILEQGETLSQSLVPVRYIFHGGNGLTTATREMTLSDKGTLLDCKTKIATLYGRSAAELKVYWMDEWENRGELLTAKDDEALITLNGPEGTLAVLSHHGLTFFFEEKTAQEEFLTISVDQYYIRFPVLQVRDGKGPYEQQQQTDEAAPVDLNPFVLAPSASIYHHIAPIVVLSTPRTPQENETLHLATLALPITTTLTELKALLYDKAYLSTYNKEHYVRFWVKGAPIPPEKEGQALKKLHLKGNKRIVVQVMEAPPQLATSKEQQRTILYVAHRNPEQRGFDTVHEFELSSGKVATWRELVDQLSETTTIPADHLLVALLDRKKHVEGGSRWHAVNETFTWTDRSFQADVFTAPFNLADGGLSLPHLSSVGLF